MHTTTDITDRPCPIGTAEPQLTDGISFAESVPRESVHKVDPSEVLLTDAQRRGADRFEVGARWPARHRLYGTRSGAADPMLVAETLRQLAIHISHRFYDVPTTHVFLLCGLDLDLDPAAGPLPAAGALGCLPVTVDVTCTPGARSGRRMSMVLEAELLVAGQRVGHGSMRWEALDPRAYAAVRRRGGGGSGGGGGDGGGDVTGGDVTSGTRGEPAQVDVEARAVGRRDRGDVLLATLPDGQGWEVVVDFGHPTYFDHPSDHLPGMVLLEAMRQAGQLAWARTLSEDRYAAPAPVPVPRGQELPDPALRDATVWFHSFAELNRPVTVQARTQRSSCSEERFVVMLSAQQDQRDVATALLQWSPGRLPGLPAPGAPGANGELIVSGTSGMPDEQVSVPQVRSTWC
ncbi:ScbA/BarX family gamma-butyrolactone biosynthesis protein [Streptacidiphilus sp. N1-3]|uniref:ScbA/BarX family gamma-butyrolactone biosynthesis protein n=1 Tax=Streptacidiphilus alkalitolerans TaxID=3342712 RepID=A0ABV6WYJ9_9ACTN